MECYTAMKKTAWLLYIRKENSQSLFIYVKLKKPITKTFISLKCHKAKFKRSQANL